MIALNGYGAEERDLLTDPQTSGGLLVACAPEAERTVLEIFQEEGFDRASVIGQIEAGTPGISVV
jgi:selenide,water dikinase